MAGETLDTKAMAAQIPLFVSIDEEVDNFFKKVKEKNVKLECLQDLERLDVMLEDFFKSIRGILEKSPFSKEDRLFLSAKLSLDMYGKISEEYNMDIESVPQYLGRTHKERFDQAENILTSMMG
jgi:methylaspartate ammonia-lyase